MAIGSSLDSSSTRVLRLGLALACLGAGAMLALETALTVPDAVSSPEPPRQLPKRPALGAVATSGAADDELVTLIAARPLFSPERRPPSPPAEQPTFVDIAKPEWSWRLAGTMIASDRREALFVRQGDRLAAGEGQQIDGWTLSAIRPDGVTLVDADAVKTLRPEPLAQDPVAAKAAATRRAVLATQNQQYRQNEKAAEGLLVAASKRMLAGRVMQKPSGR